MSTEITRQVANQWFENLGVGKFDEALSLVDGDVVWENNATVPGVTDLAPWLGSYKGLPAVLDSFKVWGRYSKMLTMEVQDMVVEDDKAIAIVHEHAQCLANNNEYDLYVATQLVIGNGKIVKWKVWWDPSPLIRAYKNLP
jgi:ketosteroid isomerase-like protein